MSTTTAPTPALPLPASIGAAARVPILLGLAGLAVSGVGFFTATKAMAWSWLIALVFWAAIALGMLFFVMIHHIFDAGWGVIVRRQAEHGIAAFPVLAFAFVPLVLVTLFYKSDVIWKWMGSLPMVTGDVVLEKKEPFLNPAFFYLRQVAYFTIWMGLAYVFRRNSFNQDRDGDVKWTHSNRRWAAFGLFLASVSLTLAAIDWMKALDYHWFSTMYGVWYFASSMRAALAVLVLICLVLAARGYYQGLFQTAHRHDLGKLMFAFTVFYAYITFSQYFIIWNANIPEETFWYVQRELHPDGTKNQWWYVSMAIIFLHFAFPFLFLIHYRTKVNPKTLGFAAIWILCFQLLDFYYNILPSKKMVNAEGLPINGVTGQPAQTAFELTPVPFLSFDRLWDLAALAAIGGFCIWMYLRSFHAQKLIPIHDPRILESVHHHE